MTLNRVSANFSQQILKNGKALQIGFECSDKTDLGYDPQLIKRWLGMHLHYWYKLKALTGQPVFNLLKPIKIEVVWNDNNVMSLMQTMVSKKFANNVKSEIAIPLKESFYLLRPYVAYCEPSLKNKKKSNESKSIKPSFFYTETLLNTIEYFCAERVSYGSPIFYTGMTN